MLSRLTKQLNWAPLQSNEAKVALKNAAPHAFESMTEMAALSPGVPVHDPPLSAREETIYFLHIAAEVEHALMVQYLYAAFSLGGPHVPEKHQATVQRWRQTIVEIAREEMGHLVTVENMLQLVGGPLTFEREDYPIPSGLYPFNFELEPLTKRSLAKYVLAEMPKEMLSSNDKETAQIKNDAQVDESDLIVNRVGAIYERLQTLLNDVASSDFAADSVQFQARHDEWGLGYHEILIRQAATRGKAQDALLAIALQGEGASLTNPVESSHYGKFLRIYHEFPDETDWIPARPVPTNPTTAKDPSSDPEIEKNRISNEHSRQWAQLFNLRYQMLLAYLSHALHIQSPLVPSSPRTSRGLLISWAFGEMYNLRNIADILTTLPRRTDGSLEFVAGPPFEMPLLVDLPEREADRWRLHRDMIWTTAPLLKTIKQQPDSALYQDYMVGLENLDDAALKIIIPVIAG